jgi:hypothetical protein
MNFDKLEAAMSGRSVTNGWDAVCALSAAELNAVCFQQYLQEGPTSPATPLRLIFQAGTDFWLLDLTLGPPEISFTADHSARQCQAKMFLLRGQLLTFDPERQVIMSALHVTPNESWLDGTVNLAGVTGEVNQLGRVVLDLASGAYRPQVEGIEPDSIVATEIGTAVQTFFANNRTEYTLGVLAESEVPASLQPTSFEFLTQPAPGGQGDGCLLLLIRTDGSGGTVGQLDPYPIPSGDTAALIVSNRTIFAGLLPAPLTAQFANLGTKFKAVRQDNGLWSVVGEGGEIKLGVVGIDEGGGEFNKGYQTYSSDKKNHEKDVNIPADSFTVSVGEGGNILAAWSQTWDQEFTSWNFDTYDGWTAINKSPKVKASYKLSAPAAVDPATDVVTFSGTPDVSFRPVKKPSWWDELNGTAISDQFVKLLTKDLKKVFAGLQIPGVDTFALANLLFPSQHLLSLTRAALPGDLLLAGQLATPLQVAPALAELKPGGTQQFTAADSGGRPVNVLWEIKPPLGSISGAGLYTAPDSISQPQVVVVTAVDRSDASLIGSAMVMVYESPAAAGLSISPAEQMLTAGQSCNLLVTDEAGQPVDAVCSLSPAAGTLTQGWTSGAWSYTAPPSVAEAAAVTVNAVMKDDPSRRGTATINLLPTAQVTLTPSDASITAGQSLQLTAAASGLDEFTWVVFPTGAGEVQRDPADGSRATYTAPASVPSPLTVMIAAYAIDDAAGIGLARVAVSPGSPHPS